MESLNIEILRDYGGTDKNDLRTILNDEADYDENSIITIQASNYHDTNAIISQLKNKQQHFKLIGFNVESLSSKIDHIRIFISLLKENNIIFDAICINECWLEDLGEDLFLDDYNAFSLTKKVGAKGGLVTYLLKDYSTTDLGLYQDSNTWEGQFLELNGNGLKSNLAIVNLGTIFVNLKQVFFQS